MAYSLVAYSLVAYSLVLCSTLRSEVYDYQAITWILVQFRNSCTHNRHKLHLLSLVQLLCLIVVQLFPNCTQIDVITYNYIIYICWDTSITIPRKGLIKSYCGTLHFLELPTETFQLLQIQHQQPVLLQKINGHHINICGVTNGCALIEQAISCKL